MTFLLSCKTSSSSRPAFAFVLFVFVSLVVFASNQSKTKNFAFGDDDVDFIRCVPETQKESIDAAIRSSANSPARRRRPSVDRTRRLARKERRSMYDFESRCGCLNEDDIWKDVLGTTNETLTKKERDEKNRETDAEKHFACHEFLTQYGKYVSWRNRVLSNDPEYERERSEAKYLVIKTAWFGVGLGHMGGIVAEWLAFAMQLKRVLFIEELAEWNVMDYFEGHLGMDLRFGDGEEIMLRERTGGKGKEATLALGALGADESTCRKGHCRARSLEEEKTCREHRDGDGKKPEYCEGEKIVCESADIAGWQCEPCLQCAADLLQNAKWVTIRANAGIKPPSLVSDPDLKNEELRQHIWQSGKSTKRDDDWDMFKVLTKTVDNSPSQDQHFPATVAQHPCLRCAFFALMRPRTELVDAWDAVLGSQAADSNRLQCLKVRTGYPESTTCFPDDTPKSDVCVEQIFSHPTCSVSYQFHTAVRLVSRTERTRYVMIKEALNCLASHKDASIHLSTDAPVVADYVSLFSPRNHANVFIVPGSGVDLNNGYRTTQEDSFQNKMKVALDFYVQGWCDDTLMLSPSEYYVAAEMRTMMPKEFANDDHHKSLCADIFGFNTTYNIEEANSWSHLPTWQEKGLEARTKAKNLDCYSGSMEEPIGEVTYTGKMSVGTKSDDELKRSAGEALTRKETKREEGEQDVSKNDDRGEGEVTKKVVEIDASTREEILESEPKMEDIDPEFMPKDDEGDIKMPSEHELNQEQNRTLTAEEISEEKWHQEAHDAVMESIKTHAQKRKEHHERKQKMLDREARERDRIAERRKKVYERELEREREHPLNKAYEMRRAERDAARKRVNDIAAQYDRILEVDEKRQVAKDMMLIHASEKKDPEEEQDEENNIDAESKIEHSEARENELEKMSELEKMPVTEPNVVVDISSNDDKKKKKRMKNKAISNLLADNFGAFLSFAFVVLFLVVLAVVRRRRRKKILLAANRAYAEGRSFIV
jgi:hypothetical protein